MIESTDRQRELVGWSVSILFHAGLLFFGAALLIQPARFHVEPGKTSTEIEFSIEPVPVVTPPLPTPIPPAQAQPVPVPEPVKPEIVPALQSIVLPPPLAPVAPGKPQPPNPQVPPKTAPVKEASSASKGALQAQPDELHNEPPEYPEESRAAREQGVVFLRVEVTAAGEPAAVSILKTSGYFRLDQAARRAVQHWKFHPAMTAGIPVSSKADVPVRFRLQ